MTPNLGIFNVPKTDIKSLPAVGKNSSLSEGTGGRLDPVLPDGDIQDHRFKGMIKEIMDRNVETFSGKENLLLEAISSNLDEDCEGYIEGEEGNNASLIAVLKHLINETDEKWPAAIELSSAVETGDDAIPVKLSPDGSDPMLFVTDEVAKGYGHGGEHVESDEFRIAEAEVFKNPVLMNRKADGDIQTESDGMRDKEEKTPVKVSLEHFVSHKEKENHTAVDHFNPETAKKYPYLPDERTENQKDMNRQLKISLDRIKNPYSEADDTEKADRKEKLTDPLLRAERNSNTFKFQVNEGASGVEARRSEGLNLVNVSLPGSDFKEDLGIQEVYGQKSIQKSLFNTFSSMEKGSVEAKEIIDQVVSKMSLVKSKFQPEMKIQLKPEFLGNLRLSISTLNHQVTVKVMTDTPLAKEIIQTNLPQLKAELSNQGLQIDKFDVFVGQDSHFSGSEKHFQEPGRSYPQNSMGRQRKEFFNNGDDGGKESFQKGGHRSSGIDYFA